MDISRGDIYRVDLEPVRGSEMKKKRPALIVSSNAINRAAAVVIVCPITDAEGKFSPIHISVPKGAGGLTKDSVVHCGQVRAVDKERLSDRIGTLDRFHLSKISRGLKIALDITL